MTTEPSAFVALRRDAFLRGYRALRIPIIDDNGMPAWPALFPVEKIDQLRATVGPRHFSAQMMLYYVSEERARLDTNALRFYTGEFNHRNARIENENIEFPITGIACYWDPSSARHGADSSVCALILRDDHARRAFIHDIHYLRVDDDDIHPMATQCGAVLDFMETHGLRHIAIEVNGLGNAMPEILRDTATRRAQALIVRRIVNHEKKERRILDAIEPLLGTGRLYAHERVRETLLLDEMSDWSPAAGAINHDDGLDAIAGALRLAPIPIRPKGQLFKQISAKTDFKV